MLEAGGGHRGAVPDQALAARLCQQGVPAQGVAEGTVAASPPGLVGSQVPRTGPEDREGIRQLGITPLHRKSFTLLSEQLELFD